VSLTDPAFFKQLDRLRIRVRAARGHRPGETPIPRTSQAWGVEFESYKDYTPGDDFRYLDWNAASRLDKLMVRTFTAEREIPFHLILDTSASMGAPSRDKKFGFATDLTAALSYIVLSSNNTLRIAALSSPEKGQRPFWATPFLRHRNRFLRVPPFLESLSPAGKTYLRESIQAYVSQTKEPGVVILVSDFLTPPRQYEAALLFLIARGYEVKAIHVMGDSELHPERLFRRGKLYDVEAQTERWVTLSRTNLEQYQDALSTHCEALQQFCHQHQILYVRVSTVQPIMQTVTDTLARSGLLTLH
jgi:uncharacterized protein (DUF58 family)